MRRKERVSRTQPHEHIGQLELDLQLPPQRPRRLYEAQLYSPERRLREAVGSYLDIRKLRRLAASGEELHKALRCDDPSPDVLALLDALTVLLKPTSREKVRSPQDVAALLILEMSYLDQEELRTVLLDTRNQLQGVVTVYKGSLNTSLIRVGEVFKAALRANSASIIVVHNHPSGEPEPSPEDILVTHQIIEAGRLLDVQCLDHLVIGQGRWVSLRERGLGFS